MQFGYRRRAALSVVASHTDAACNRYAQRAQCGCAQHDRDDDRCSDMLIEEIRSAFRLGRDCR
jgi:hypothetical protein